MRAVRDRGRGRSAGFSRAISATRGKWWLILGSIFYLGAALVSIAKSIAMSGIGDDLIMAIDWFAACVVYFFLGGLIGAIIDWILSRRGSAKGRRPGFPAWAALALLLWVVSAVLSLSVTRPGTVGVWLGLFFPFAFGIFFTGTAFVILFPKSITQSLYGKMFFNLAYVCVFAAWLWLTAHRMRTSRIVRILRQALLGVLFGVLFLGLAGCIRFLS